MTQLKQKSIILFDLDGTVIDSQEGIFNSLAYTFEKLGMGEQDHEKMLAFIGPAIGSSFKNLFGMDEQEATHAVDIYREYYQPKGIFECTAYEGIEPLLKRLKSQGKRIAIATKKPEPFAKTVLIHLDLAKYFDAICGSELHEANETKAHIINRATTLLGAKSKNEVILIGDTKYDVIGANEAGVDCLGVLYGFGSQQELREHKAVAIAKSIKELTKMLCE